MNIGRKCPFHKKSKVFCDNYPIFIEQKIKYKKLTKKKHKKNFQIRPYMKLPLTIL